MTSKSKSKFWEMVKKDWDKEHKSWVRQVESIVFILFMLTFIFYAYNECYKLSYNNESITFDQYQEICEICLENNCPAWKVPGGGIGMDWLNDYTGENYDRWNKTNMSGK